MSATIEPGARARARGAWLGQICGDALGTTVEFEPPARIAARYPGGLREIEGGGPFALLPGQVTDDTELALAMARSIAVSGRYDRDAVAAAYLAWYRSGPFAVGNTTRQALGDRGAPPAGPGLAERVEARAAAASQANGSLMRISPLGLFGWRLPTDRLVALAAADSRLTHPSPVCQAACAVMAHALAHAIRSGAGAEEVHAAALALADADPVCAPVRDTLAAAADGPPADFVVNMGWVRIALQNAFHQLLRAPSLEEGLVDTVMRGGDSDTNGCIAGALLGAVHGEGAVPARWQRVVLACRSDRGPAYQAHDALALADALLEAGAAATGQVGPTS